MTRLEDFRCPNPVCPWFGLPNFGNIITKSYSGRARVARMLHCHRCGNTFSQRAWSFRYHSHLPEDKDEVIFECLRSGLGVRETARRAGVSRNTVRRRIRTITRLDCMERIYQMRCGDPSR